MRRAASRQRRPGPAARLADVPATKGGVKRQARRPRRARAARERASGGFLGSQRLRAAGDRPLLRRRAAAPLRIGYPTTRLSSGLERAAREGGFAGEAVLAITTSKRFRISGVRVGSSHAACCAGACRGERRVRVGQQRLVHGSGQARAACCSARRGKVSELGLGDKRLTATRRGTVRFLRAWDRRGL